MMESLRKSVMYVGAGAWCASLSLFALAQTDGWDTYVNHRFEYLVEYPKTLLAAQREAANGDGREFHAKHGAAKVAVWGRYVDKDIMSAAEDAQITKKECAVPESAYVVMKADLQAVSCTTQKGDVLYYKAIEKKDRLAAVEAHYPLAEKAQWDDVVARMAKSLHLADTSDE